MEHAFAVCAYGESIYLEECVKSLIQQSVKSNIIIATSTPNGHIYKIADKYEIPVYVNMGEKGITRDWNYAYDMVNEPYVTIAHQDDVYHKDYTKNALNYLKKSKNPIIYFTDYGEIRNGETVTSNKLLKIKRIMLFPLRIRAFWKSRFVRRRILSMGSPICCPSVLFVKENCPNQVFTHGFRADEDWEAWEMLSRRKGSFVYNSNILTYHRIHEESETTKILGDNARHKEDYIMYCKFWPKFIAKILTGLYGTSEKSNKLSK